MEQKRPFIQDCEVSAWTSQGCSKSCGGGQQNFFRQVVAPADKGASCPPLAMQQSCNTQACPIDCSMGEWSGWTSCSAKCGGGVKQRLRRTKQRAQHGGKLCGVESESEGCGCQISYRGPRAYTGLKGIKLAHIRKLICLIISKFSDFV